MTVQEMHYAIDQGLQKVGSHVYEDFESEELDFFLNKMQERFIKDNVFAFRNARIQRRLDNIRVLLVLNQTDTVTIEDGDTQVSVDLQDDYDFLINLRALLTRATGDTDTEYQKPARIVEQDELHTALQNPFAKSQFDSPVASMSGNSIIMHLNESFILKEVRHDYIRKPAEISLSSVVDCELPEHTHHEIVGMTVNHILEVIGSPRYQTNSVDQSKDKNI